MGRLTVTWVTPILYFLGGGGEIRTHDPVSRVPLFKSGAFNHSSHSSIFLCFTDTKPLSASCASGYLNQ